MNTRHIGLPKISTIIFVALLTSGCNTTPNLTPFAEQTQRLQLLHAQETGAIADRFDQVVKATPAGTLKTGLDGHAKQFKKHTKVLDDVFKQAAVYSDALASLAAAGDTGSEAAASLLESMDGFAAALSIPTGGASLGAAAFANTLKKIADLATKEQARRSLREAVMAADPVVQEMARELVQLYCAPPPAAQQAGGGQPAKKKGAFSCTPKDAAIVALADQQVALLRTSHGPAIINFYQKSRSHRDRGYGKLSEILEVRQLANSPAGLCISNAQKTPETCASLVEMQALEQLEKRIHSAAPDYQSFQVGEQSIRTWQQSRIHNRQMVAEALHAWAQEHGRLVKALDRGLDLRAINLKLILDHIKPLKEAF